MTDPGSEREAPPPGALESGDEGRGSRGPRGYKGDAIRGSLVSMIQTGVGRSLTLVCQIIFARLLVPSDFGLVAVALGINALLSVVRPESLKDLLVQRGERLANALPSAWKLLSFASVASAVAILLAAQFISVRSGDEIRTIDGGSARGTTTLAEIRSDPPLPDLIGNLRGEVSLRCGDVEGRFRLPVAVDGSTTIDQYAALLNATLAETFGNGRVLASLDAATDRLTIGSPDGRTAVLETGDSVASDVMEVLGIPARSNVLLVMIVLLGIRPLINLLATPFAAAATLTLRFEQIAFGTLVGDVIGYGIAIGVVLMGGGAIGLVLPVVLFPLTVLINSARISGALPKIEAADREPILPLLKDAILLWIGQWSIGASRQVPALVLAVFASSSETGYYTWATLISVQVNVVLTVNLSNALVPIFSNLQNDPRRVSHGFMRAARTISGFTMPLFIGAAAVTPVLIPVVFGAQWNPAIEIAAILLIAQSFSATQSLCTSVLKGTGRFGTWFRIQFVQTVFFIGTAALASWAGGAIGLTWGMFVLFTLFPQIMIWLCVRHEHSVLEVIRINGLPMLACLPFVLVALGSRSITPDWLALLVWCPLMLLVALAAYILLIRLVEPARYRELLGVTGEVWRKLRRAKAA